MVQSISTPEQIFVNCRRGGSFEVIKSTFRLTTILGIEFGVHYSWFLVFFVFSYLLAESRLPSMYEGWSVTEYWLVAIISVLLLFVSVLLHELGHSLVARRRGIPVHGITLFFFGGVAELEQESETARDEFMVAIAGPIVSLMLAVLFFAIRIAVSDAHIQLEALIGYLALVNLLLAAFNMLPGFPMDGGRVLRAAVWSINGNEFRATAVATTIGTCFGWLFLGIGLLIVVSGNLFSGLWIIVVGWFLQHAARQTAQANRQDEAFSGVQVQELMNPTPPTIHPEVSLHELVEQYVLGQNVRGIVVVEDDEVVGIITITDIKSVDRALWPDVPVRQAMTPKTRMQMTQPGVEIIDALDVMAGNDINQLPVMKDGRLIGLLNRSDLVNYLQELGLKV